MNRFFERFPKYALLAQQWEAQHIDEGDLTKWREGLKLNGIEILYVFGLRPSAYHLLCSWLHESSERRVVFLEEDTGIIATALQNSPELFDDPQVDFECLPVGKEADFLMEELSDRYPVGRIEVVSLPGTASARFRRLRLELLRKTTLSQGLFLDRFHGHHLFKNFVQNVPHLVGAFYANGLKNAFAGIPAIVCGAGPSLKKAIPLLEQLEGRAIVIAGGSTLAALSSAGYEPHFGIAIDPNLEEYRRFRNSFAFECPLLTSTRVFPGIFNTCNGPFGYLRSAIGGASELWLDQEMGLTDPLLGEDLAEESMSVTMMALAFIRHIGCGPILLSGVDLAYTGGERYAPGVSEERTKGQTSLVDQILRRKDKRGRPLYTAVRWLMEAASISNYAKRHPEIRWINTTEGGLSIEGIEEMPLEVAASAYLTRQWDLRGLVAQQIALHPMPAQNPNLLKPLQESLERTIGHLEVLAGVKRGSLALAECEIKEELASSVLFYDMDKVLAQALSRREGNKWDLYLKIASRYAQAF